jgi:hypothetical protein
VVNLFTFGGNSAILARRANGTVGSPTALLNGENAFVIRTGGYGATGFDGGSGASIQFPATENWTDSAQGQNVLITATANSATVSSTIGTFSSTGLAVTGALSSTTGANFATSSGNVGIGTASPSAKLQVSGVTPVLNGGYGQLQVFSTNALAANVGGKISLGGVSGEGSSFDPYGFVAIAGLKENATASNFAGYFTVSTAGSGGAVLERMRIDSSGNVGIGTSSPDQRLAINSANTSTNSLLSVKQGDVTQAYVGMGSDNILRLESLARPAGIQAGGANHIFFNTNSSERVRIDSSGNVGIGTTSPGSKLDVNGELRIGNTVATAVAVASTHKVTIVIGGTTYYLLATNV